jgi:hypothetical protein
MAVSWFIGFSMLLRPQLVSACWSADQIELKSQAESATTFALIWVAALTPSKGGSPVRTFVEFQPVAFDGGIATLGKARAFSFAGGWFGLS